jgi:16S rRNA (uracil1498-N3)-methyltransferase
MQLFYQPELHNGANFLDEEESSHCVKVLRHKEGDLIHVVDGIGSFYECRITKAHQKKCELEILLTKREEPLLCNIHIAIAPTKNADRLEWFVEKATEIGIQEITLLQTEHSERKFQKTDRLEKKAIAAMKQSLKAFKPVINPQVDYEKFIKSFPEQINKFIAYVDQEIPQHLKDAAPSHASYVVLIGPEGDFSSEEVKVALEQNFTAVSLGKSRLRTETAGIYACMVLNLMNE